MNIDQYFALYSNSTDAKVAHSDWKAQERKYELLLDELLENPEQPVTCEQLREALIELHRVHRAHVDCITTLLLDLKGI